MNTPRTEVIAQRCSTDGEYSDVKAYNLMYAHARQLETELSEMRTALERVLPYVATQAIGCHGEKCREPWCWSCNGEDEAIKAAEVALNESHNARAILEKTK